MTGHEQATGGPRMDDPLRVPGALDGERVDRALATLTGLSRREVNTLIDAGRVRIGRSVSTSRSRRVREGDRLELTGDLPSGGPEAPQADPAVDVPVVWSDEDVIVVDKPAGLVVHPGAGNPGGTLVNGLLALFPEIGALSGGGSAANRPGVVHRLDKGTSGLLAVARSRQGFESLTSQIGARTVGREYLALVVGRVESDAGVVDAPVGRSAADPTRMAVQVGGRHARTGYEVVSRFDPPSAGGPVACTLLRCRLETGRTHQVRVHFASIGHPVVGDERYGPRKPGPFPALRAGRHFLHAAKLSFDHPATAERMSFDSPLPADLAAVLDSISQSPAS